MGYQEYPAYFTIQVRDNYGNNITSGGEVFEFLMSSATVSSVQNITYSDNNDGTYTVSYIAPLPGTYNLTITAGAGHDTAGVYIIPILPGTKW